MSSVSKIAAIDIRYRVMSSAWCFTKSNAEALLETAILEKIDKKTTTKKQKTSGTKMYQEFKIKMLAT